MKTTIGHDEMICGVMMREEEKTPSAESACSVSTRTKRLFRTARKGPSRKSGLVLEGPNLLRRAIMSVGQSCLHDQTVGPNHHMAQPKEFTMKKKNYDISVRHVKLRAHYFLLR
jgi:hypothetical protein